MRKLLGGTLKHHTDEEIERRDMVEAALLLANTHRTDGGTALDVLAAEVYRLQEQSKADREAREKAEGTRDSFKDIFLETRRRAEAAEARITVLNGEVAALREALGEIAEEEDCCALSHPDGLVCCLREAGLRRMAEDALARLRSVRDGKNG